jgi:hypothetical protein
MNRRRIFLKSISGLAAASAVAPLAGLAQTATGTAPQLSESDPQAVSLGYKADTTKVDQKKFPKHANSQECGGCQFYQGAASAASAPCTIFGGKQVATKGWCSAWVKKTATG